MDISEFNPGMELKERNYLSVSRTRKEPEVVCQMPKQFIFSDNIPGWVHTEIWNYTTRRMQADFAASRLEIQKGGGTMVPVKNGYENFFYVIGGKVSLGISPKQNELGKGGYCWLPPGTAFEISNKEEETAVVFWLKKVYEPLKDTAVPEAVVGNVMEQKACGGTAELKKECITASRDWGFDMSADILIYYPGVSSERVEIHMSAHGAYVLSGRGEMVVNGRHYETHENDYFYIAPCASHYMAAFAPEPLCILSFEEVNRDYALS